MLQSTYSSEELRIQILDVLIERIAIDAMPDYFMILNESILKMLALSRGSAAVPDSPLLIEVRDKSLDVLDLMKWAMTRSDQWTPDYDDAVESRLARVQPSNPNSKGFRNHLKKYVQGEKLDSVSERRLRSKAKPSDYTEDIERHKNNDKAHNHDEFSWITEAFNLDGQSTPGDFEQWLEALCKHCLNQNPSQSLKTLHNLGKIDGNKVHLIVFNTTFYTIWKDPNDFMDDGYGQAPPPPSNQPNAIEAYRKDIIKGLSTVIVNEKVPDHVHSVFLNLANFIEHCEADKEKLNTFGESLRAFGGADGIKALGDCAERIAAYPKALHYREMEFLRCQIQPNSTIENKREIAESLINIYSKLDVHEAAEGVLDYATANDINVSAKWYEKLQHWEDAKERYQIENADSGIDYDTNPDACATRDENKLGYMRCLKALGEWEELQLQSTEFLRDNDSIMNAVIGPHDQEKEVARKKRQIDAAKLAAISEWQNENWPNFEETLRYLPTDEFDGSFFQAVNFVRKQKFEQANDFIKKARYRLHKILREIEKNSQQPYSRIYPYLLNAQLLSELEEVMYLKSCHGASREHARRIQLQKMWEQRLIGSNIYSPIHGTSKIEGVRPQIQDWQKVLMVRSLDQVINRSRRSDQSGEINEDDIFVRKTEFID